MQKDSAPSFCLTYGCQGYHSFLGTTPPKIATAGARQPTASCVMIIFAIASRRQGGPFAWGKVTQSTHL